MNRHKKRGKHVPIAHFGFVARFLSAIVVASVCLMLVSLITTPESAAEAQIANVEPGNVSSAQPQWQDYFSPSVIALLVLLILLSAFFSSSETAFMSIPKPRLRTLREEGEMSGVLVAQMLEHPGSFLTTVLVGNTVVNIIIGVVLGTRVKDLLEGVFQVNPAAAYATAIGIGAGVLVLLGDIVPKVLAVRTSEGYARVAVYPLIAANKVLAPLRDSLIRITDLLFRVTRFHQLHAAPYITDEELAAMLAQTTERGKEEDDGRQMIRRILEFHDVQLREILVPRPDVVALPEDATVAEALQNYREYEYSRLPVFREDLDHIVGILFAKDLIPPMLRNEMDRKINTLVRPPHFVPETMSVQRFIKDVQRLRSHLAVVVDEFGGTEGVVTLHDAVEQVVGDIRDEFDEEQAPYEQISEGVYRVQGGIPLDELEELTGRELGKTEHQTVAGLLMDMSEKVPEAGDVIHYRGITFKVEQVKGKRASMVWIEIPPQAGEEEEE